MPCSKNSREPTGRAASRHSGDDGSASVEFITVGVVLLIPLVYLIVTLAGLQGAILAADGAAAQAAKLYARAGDDTRGRERAEDLLALTLVDFGIDRSQAALQIDCAPRTSPCGGRGGTVTATVRILVRLPLAPELVSIGGAIPVVGTATVPISRFGEAEPE